MAGSAEGPKTDRGRPPRVVSLGSVNVDYVHDLTASEVRRYEREYDWFPASDETVRVETPPPDVPEEPDEVHHGGKGANQAVAAAMAGATTEMLGMVGPDADGAGVFDALESGGVHTDHLGRADLSTGTAHIFREPSGDVRIVAVAGANDRVDRGYVESVRGIIDGADCLLVQNEIDPDPVVELLDDLGGATPRPTVVFDPAPADGSERFLDAPAVDYCTPNEREYRELESGLASFEGCLVRKQGPDPVVVTTSDGEQFEVMPPSVNVADATGAGDVFAGYLGTRLAAGSDLRSAVETATVAASLSTRAPGARAGIPAVAEVRAFEKSD